MQMAIARNAKGTTHIHIVCQRGAGSSVTFPVGEFLCVTILADIYSFSMCIMGHREFSYWRSTLSSPFTSGIVKGGQPLTGVVGASKPGGLEVPYFFLSLLAPPAVASKRRNKSFWWNTRPAA